MTRPATAGDGLVSLADVAGAARRVLQQRMPAQLGALTRRLPVPTDYHLVPDSDHVRRVRGVALALSAAGLSQRPQRTGGTYRGVFVLSVAVIAEDSPATPLLTAAPDYAAAARACLLQSHSLGGLASDVEWTAESFDLLGDETSNRVLGLAITEFAVSVDDVVDPSADPQVPRGTGPLVQHIEIDYRPQEAP